MKNVFVLALFLLVLREATAAPSSIVKETLYQNFRKDILSENKSKMVFSALEQSLYVDALWDLTEEEDQGQAFKVLNQGFFFHYDLAERLRLGILLLKHGKEFPVDLARDLEAHLLAPKARTKIIYTVAAYSKELSAAGLGKLITLAKAHPQYAQYKTPVGSMDAGLVKDVFDFVSAAPGVRVYLFCRQNRLYPCLMTLRNNQGEIVRNEDGSLWTHKALALSVKGLASTKRNGNTPPGILKIESVMPEADEQVSFGKFRRMILDFVPKSKNEVDFKALLPPSSHKHTWWKPNTIARDIGRDLLRIHGTGKINTDPQSTFYPFMRTSGCVAQRENTYDGVTYQDQRDLLDTVMGAMGLTPTYENETSIRGLLYLMDIDNLEKEVTEEDLNLRGIF